MRANRVSNASRVSEALAGASHRLQSSKPTIVGRRGSKDSKFIIIVYPRDAPRRGGTGRRRIGAWSAISFAIAAILTRFAPVSSAIGCSCWLWRRRIATWSAIGRTVITILSRFATITAAVWCSGRLRRRRECWRDVIAHAVDSLRTTAGAIGHVRPLTRRRIIRYSNVSVVPTRARGPVGTGVGTNGSGVVTTCPDFVIRGDSRAILVVP